MQTKKNKQHPNPYEIKITPTNSQIKNGQQEIAREAAIKILRQSQTQQGLVDSV